MNNDERNFNTSNSSNTDTDENKPDTDENSPKSSGDYLVKRNKRMDFIAKVICFLGAFILWFYVMQVESPEYQQVFSQVPVSYSGMDVIGTNHNLSVYSVLDNAVDVTVKGRKSEIGKIKADDIIATADVSAITEAGEYKINVNVSLPSNLTIETISPGTVNVYVDEVRSVPLEIVAKIQRYTEAPNQIGDIIVENPEVTVTGPKRAVDALEYAQVSGDVGKISATVNMVSKIELVKKNGTVITSIPSNLKMSKTEAAVKVPVYTYKDLPLVVMFRYDYFNDSNVDISISPESVRVKGDPMVLANYSYLEVATLNEKRITSDETRHILITVPDDIEIADDTSQVVVDIKHKNTITREIKYRNSRISVVNSDGIDYEILDENLTITFRGTEEDIEKLQSSDVKVTLDFSDINEISGIISQPATITLSDNVGESIYEIGDYSVQVEIK